MVKLALWMPLLSLAAFAVTSPVQNSPDGRDLRSQDSHAESTFEKKQDIKLAAFLGIEYVSGVAIEFIDRLPQDYTDIVYAVLKEIGFSDKEDGIADITRASETVDLRLRDLSSPDSRAESGPDKKAFIKRRAKELFDFVYKASEIAIDSFSEELTDALYNILPRLQRFSPIPLSVSPSNSTHANEMVDLGVDFYGNCPSGQYRRCHRKRCKCVNKPSTKRDSTQAPPIEIFDSAMEIFKHIVASNFGINLSDLTQTLREAIPEGIMEKPIADPDNSDDNDDTDDFDDFDDTDDSDDTDDDIAATEAHSSSSADECAPGYKLHHSCAAEGRQCRGWDTRGRCTKWSCRCVKQ